VASATVADIFTGSQTGVTKSGNNDFIASNANAYGAQDPAAGALLFAFVAALPGAGQTLDFGAGSKLGITIGPSVVINSAGVATVSNFGTTAKTFAGTVVAGGANSTFVFRPMLGATLIAQMNGNTIADTALVPNVYLAAEYVNGGFFGGIGFQLKGYGTLTISNAEVYST
jgi:hypothetical protein